MIEASCSVEGCDRPIRIKSLQICNVHYIRLRVHGHPLAGGEERGQPLQWILDRINTEADECLPWPFSVNDHGYGRIRHDGREWVASRLMCTMKHGDAPSDRHEAAHSCGNGHLGCTNPNHLRWATPEANQADRVGHGTSNRGTRNAHSKLDETDVLRAISLRADGMTQRLIAAELRVSEMTISDIFSGQRWGWLTGIEKKERPHRNHQPAANDNVPAEQRRAA